MNALPHEMCHVSVCWLGWESLTHLAPPLPSSYRDYFHSGNPMDCTEENLVLFGIFSSAVSAVSYYQCSFG